MLRNLNRPTGHKTRFSTPLVVQPGESRPSGDRVSLFQAPTQAEWWHHLPELVSARVRLRELCLGDAAALTAALASPKVAEHLSPGPTSLAEIEAFISWARRARREARYICFGVVPCHKTDPVGVFQLWPLEPSFRTAEWGFALDPAYWGTGLFAESASLLLEFGFESLGAMRLEARAAVGNVRGNGALRKLGAVPEGLLRQCFMTDGEYRDHVLWALLAKDWRNGQVDGAGVAGEVA
jgi:ribosomal-protein-alanine N-acetyltransferase